VLAWPPLLWIGLVSYGAYLYHFAVLEQLGNWHLDVWRYLWFPIGLAGALAIAALSWYAFERPLLSFKRLVPARRADEDEAALKPAP
jgi:peptidoglycan/LPS O-acetylase OafA/YrhL